MRIAGNLLVAGLALATVVGAGAVVACSSVTVPKEVPACTLQMVGITVIASPQLNPEVDGAARPVQLRLYQLKTDTRFQNARRSTTSGRPTKATLQDDLVKVEQAPHLPGHPDRG